MSHKKKKIAKLTDRQYSEYLARLRADGEEGAKQHPDDR